MPFPKARHFAIFGAAFLFQSCTNHDPAAIVAEKDSLRACADLAAGGLRKIADTRDQRFLGKVQEATALCRGGQKAVQFRPFPWLDWSNYWGTGDETRSVLSSSSRRTISGPQAVASMARSSISNMNASS